MTNLLERDVLVWMRRRENKEEETKKPKEAHARSWACREDNLKVIRVPDDAVTFLAQSTTDACASQRLEHLGNCENSGFCKKRFRKS